MAFTVQAKPTAVRAARPARRSVVARAAARQSWLPGSQAPAHLNGTLAGDFGFDPLNLGKDPEALRWYQQAELIHGRTAMTAVAGILIPGILTKAGLLHTPEWYDAGKVYIESADAIPFATLAVVQFFMCHFVEVKRWQDWRKPKSQAEKGSFFGLEAAFEGTEPSYPGGPFDPLGLSRQGADKLADYKLKEIKNGRLAMVAFIGFCGQYGATGKGPIDNLIDHVADPFGKTIATNGVSIPGL